MQRRAVDLSIVTRTSRAEVTAENKRKFTRGDAVFSCRIIIERAFNFL